MSLILDFGFLLEPFLEAPSFFADPFLFLSSRRFISVISIPKSAFCLSLPNSFFLIDSTFCWASDLDCEQNSRQAEKMVPSTLMISRIQMKTRLRMKTPTNSMPSMMAPIRSAMSPPRKYSGKVVTSRWTIEVEASTAMEAWNMNELSQVFPSFMGWILKKGMASLTKKMPLRVAMIIQKVRRRMKPTETNEAPSLSIKTRNLSKKTL